MLIERMATQVEGLVHDAALWRQNVAGRAPANHRLLEELDRLLAESSPEAASVRDRIERVWEKRSFGIFYERPLLVFAAFRFDALRAGSAHPLFRALALPQPELESLRRETLLAAMASESLWESLERRFVQTNETSRAVAWLWPAALAGAGRPIVAVEIGCSAGLNLVADRLPWIWSVQAGAPLSVVRRLGIDRNPLDVFDDEAVAWMRACIWAGEAARLERFDAAVDAFRRDPPELVQGNATHVGEALQEVSLSAPDTALVVAFQTIVRDYFDPETNERYESGLRSWIRSCPPGRALWTELEIDHSGWDRAHPAVIRAHALDENGSIVDLDLARTSYHPSELAVDPDAVARLCALFQR